MRPYTMSSSGCSFRRWNTDDEDGDEPTRTKEGLVSIIYRPSFEVGRRVAMWTIARVSSKANKVYMALVNSSFRWDSHQGDGYSYALHPVQRKCRWRMVMSWLTKVQRGGLLLSSAEGLFTSASTGAACAWRILQSRDLHIPCINDSRPSPLACK